ncbi:hypothetical protein JZK55_05380 [Dissulfurispira thermophila]|uniref:Rho termination factor-like N-terminal domain-containing protein n=2 Tax=root TaxID=1 RepID=A0A7G1H0Q0_9BACT|nr:DUF4912 domain-containing protein [Dissulfurispira thermophila]BCB95616.1 hypothetical protein JZK55_05380 [Dissulfurispira thermophila]
MKRQKATKKVKAEKKAKTKKTKKAISKKKTVKKTATKTVPKKPVKKSIAKKNIKKVAKKTTIKTAIRKSLTTKPEIKKTLDKLTVAELKALAKELGITLKSGLKKADIIIAISKSKVKIEKSAQEKTKRTQESVPVLLHPKEYGENKLASMPVTPTQVYTYWEITEDTLSQYQGSLNLKVINTNTKAFFYMPISERIGEQFINVRPAGEYTVEIGVINYKGEFVRILKSTVVETPSVGVTVLETKEESQIAGLSEEFFEIPESISSY